MKSLAPALRPKVLISVTILLLVLTWTFGVFRFRQIDRQHERLKTTIKALGGRFHVDGNGYFSYIVLKNIDSTTDLSFFKLIPNELKDLSFKDCSLNLNQDIYEKKFRQLKFLKFYKCDLGNSRLKATNFSSLEGLSIVETHLSNDFFDGFSPPTLKRIALSDTLDVTNEFIVKIGAIPSLEEVVLSGNQNIDGQGIKHLEGLDKLKKLVLMDSNLAGLDFSHFRSKSMLEYLDARRTNMNTKILETGSKFHNLRFLALGVTDVGNDCKNTIVNFKKLQFLSVDGTGVTNDFVKTAEKLPKLKRFLIDTKDLTASDMPRWDREIYPDGGFTELTKPNSEQTKVRGTVSENDQ